MSAPRYRLGRHHDDTVYLQLGEQPDDADPRVAIFWHADAARQFVRLTNAAPEPRPASPCMHKDGIQVHNAEGEPVRLLCACGREWRVLPAEWKLQRLDGAEGTS